MATRFAAKLESRALIAVRGVEARGFLQGLISNDVEKVAPAQAIHAALLTPQGKFLFEFFVHADAQGLVLDADAARAGDLIKRLGMYKLRAKIEIAAVADAEVVAVWGEGAPPDGFAADPRLPALGWRGHLRAGGFTAFAESEKAQIASESDYHRARILLGVPDGAMDLEPEQMFLLDANFEELNGVDFKKGCYVGQELTARMKHRGTARRRMLPVRGAGALPAPGTPIVDDGGREIGELRGSIGDVGMSVLRLDRVSEATALSASGVGLDVLKPAYAVLGLDTAE